jgi:hypothetical protein
MVAVGLVLLLIWAISLGFRWNLNNPGAYFGAVALVLTVWVITFGMSQSYAAMLPGMAAILGSIVLGLVGLRGIWRMRTSGSGYSPLWIIATACMIAPLAFIIWFWFVGGK